MLVQLAGDRLVRGANDGVRSLPSHLTTYQLVGMLFNE
jgi:hypothetical protein